MTFYIKAVILVFCLQNVLGIVDVLVETEVGWIRGIEATDGNYTMFLGIPYAKVDENNHFGPSSPYPKFESIFEANDDSWPCPQIELFSPTVIGTLDCLRLNIYVPNTNSNNLPVLAMIHGGLYRTGSAGRYIFGPKFLVRHDVILVTLNYRLGPYGFMCLHTPSVPGNQGLKDQLTALRWIRDNIKAFGGDADKVTVVGESAGARSIDLHLMSPQEKLFHRAILQSGSVLNPGWFPEPDVEAPIKLAASLGFTTNSLDEALLHLSKSDTNSVIEAATRINTVFRLCIEKDFENTEKFITGHPLNLNVPKAVEMPIMIGYTSQEMIINFISTNPEFFDTLDLFNDQLKIALDFDNEMLTDLERIVRQFYIGDKMINEEVKFELADFSSDIIYAHPTVRNIARYIENGAIKLYYYVFSYNGGRNFLKRIYNVTVGGANHADELGYLYDISFFPEEPTPNDQQMIDRITTMWTNFAKYGNPTPTITDLLPVKWEPVTKNSAYNYLDIDSELKTGMRPFHRRMTFWDLFYKAYWEYQFGYSDGNSSSLSYVHPFCMVLLVVHCLLKFV